MPSSTSSSEVIEAQRRQYDERLVSMQRKPGDWKFVATIGSSALLCIVLWSIALPYLPRYVPTLNQQQDNRKIIMNYRSISAAPITLSGTSLTDRLSSGLFDTTTANVALPGQSPVSSALVASQKHSKILIIEINVLDRPRAIELEQFGARVMSPPAGLQTLTFAYSPVRSVVSLAYGLDDVLDYQLSASAKSARKLTEKPPEPLRYNKSVYETAKALDTRPADDSVRNSAHELRLIADQLEAQGSRVFYLLMPMHPVISSTQYKARGLRAMADEDPNFEARLLKVDWSEELRWDPDGVHLDSRSAAIAAQQIEKAIQDSVE